MKKTAWKLGVGLVLSMVAAFSAQAEDLRGKPGVTSLPIGVFAPMSGVSAGWGLGAEFVAKQAADHIANNGGIVVDGKTYVFEVKAYDNGYSAAEGTRAGQVMLNRDQVKYIVNGLGTAPVRALQSLSERGGALLFHEAWGMSVKGPQFPLSFTESNTGIEILEQLYPLVKERHPEIKRVALLNPNDATGLEVERVAIETWKKLGVEVVGSFFYERGTTEFQPIATKLAQLNVDAIDLCSTAPADGGATFRELAVQGWKGIKIFAAGSGADATIKMAGSAAAIEGMYMGNAADYSSATATPIQRELNERGTKALGEPLNGLHIGVWDAIMGLKAAMEASNSLDPVVIAKTLPTIVFESSYGPASFGGAARYGSPQQILVPVVVTQMLDGKVVEVTRIQPEELRARLAATGSPQPAQ